MKISKLFHWLYAFLMFLPITFILPTLMYYGFNDNAAAQEYTKEVPIYYQSNNVNQKDDIVLGNIYTWNAAWNNTQGYSTQEFYTLDVSLLNFEFASANNNIIYGKLLLSGSGASNAYVYVDYADNTYNYISISNRVFSFIPLTTLSGYANMPSDFVSCIGISQTNWIKEIVTDTYTMGITESVNQAIIDTFDLPMFSWATNNILVAPFSSICSFFGIASTSVLIKYLYYWLTISVIWLVFDVLMYIPLLVHNYIDKARIE